MKNIAIIAGLGALAFSAYRRSPKADERKENSNKGKSFPTPNEKMMEDNFLPALAASGISPRLGKTLAVIAYRESNFNPTATNGSESERKSAASLYQKDPGRWSCSGAPSEAYQFGSGGWYGFLPVTAVASSGNNCADPELSVYAPAESTASAVGYAGYLVKRWNSSHDSPATPLIVMARWGSPGRKGGSLEHKIKVERLRSKRLFGESANMDWLEEPIDYTLIPSPQSGLERLKKAGIE